MMQKAVGFVFCFLSLFCFSLEGDSLIDENHLTMQESKTVAGASNLSLAITDSGNLTAMWQQPSTKVTALMLAFRSLGGDWSAPYTVPVSEESSHPFLTGNKTENLVATWEGLTVKPSQLSSIRTCLDVFNGSWENSELVASSSSLLFLLPNIAMNGLGNQAVAWEGLDSSSGLFIVHLATKFAPSLAWSTPIQISKGQLLTFPNVAIDNQNRTAAIWIEKVSQQSVVRASVGANGSWSLPEQLSTIGSSASNPSPKIVLNNNLSNPIGLAAWAESDSKSVVIRTRFRNLDRWGPSSILQVPGAASTQPVIAFNDSNRAIVVWQSSQDNVNWIIQAALYDPSSGWTEPQALSTASAKLAQIAMNANGEAVLAWEIILPGEKSSIDVTILSQEGEWGPVTRFSDENINTTARVAINDSGNMGLVWLANDGSRVVVKASVNDGSGDWTPAETISSVDF